MTGGIEHGDETVVGGGGELLGNGKLHGRGTGI